MKNKKNMIIGASIVLVIVVLITTTLLLNRPTKEDQEKNKLDTITKHPDVILRDDGVARYVGEDEITTNVEDKNDVFEVLEEVGGYFKIEEPKSVLEIKSVQESADFKYYKLSQKYNGVKVYGNELVITVNKDNKVTSITGKYIPLSDIYTYSSISIDKMEENLSTILNKEYELIEKQKYIYIKDSTPIYCYVYTIGINSEIYDLFIDAREGKEVERISKSYSSNYSYTGKDIYGNDKTISINQTESGGYQLRDNDRNINIVNATGVVADWGTNLGALVPALAFRAFMINQQNPANVIICKDGALSTDFCVTSDTNFTRNSISGMENFVKTYDYYKNVLGRTSYDGAGAEINVNVGFVANMFNEEYENAAWYGSYKAFGFGSANNISLVAALDIVAHEYTHAVSGSIVDLVYQDESGALNEAYSDIMGSLIEGKNFEIAEDIGGYRDMANPNRYEDPMIKDGKYYFPTDTETYDEEFQSKFSDGKWQEWDHGGVHTNSGVPNYTAFLMYDNGAFSSKEEMAKVWYNSLFLLSPNADFEDCALAVIQTAKNFDLAEDKIKIIEDSFKTTKMFDEEYGTLSGKVTSNASDTPLQGVVVTAINQLNPHVYYQTTTNEQGEYKFEELSPVEYLITFEMPKHNEYEEKITIVKNENSTLNAQLEAIEEKNYKNSEIVFVLDVSLSMNESDPTNIRKQIINNILSSLDDKSNVALVVFTGKAKLINNGLSNKNVDKKILITDIFNMVNDSGHNDDSGTNGRAGLEAGLNLFKKDSETRKYIVFLTDGQDNKYSGLSYDEIIKKSNDLGIRILTIGLGQESQLDEDVLIKLADATNGKYYHATKSSNLYEFDKRIFAELE